MKERIKTTSQQQGKNDHAKDTKANYYVRSKSCVVKLIVAKK